MDRQWLLHSRLTVINTSGGTLENWSAFSLGTFTSWNSLGTQSTWSSPYWQMEIIVSYNVTILRPFYPIYGGTAHKKVGSMRFRIHTYIGFAKYCVRIESKTLKAIFISLTWFFQFFLEIGNLSLGNLSYLALKWITMTKMWHPRLLRTVP